MVGLILLAVFALFLFLKRRRSALPMLFLGLFALLLDAAGLWGLGSVTTPRLFYGVLLFALGGMITAALPPLPIRNPVLRFLPTCAAGLFAAAAFLIPFCSKTPVGWTAAVLSVEILLCVFCALALGIGVWRFIRGSHTELSCALAASAVLICVLADGLAAGTFAASCVWVLLLFVIWRDFILIERENRRLTDNMRQEVEIRTNSLNLMLEEREKLLAVLSHNLKKPTLAIRDSLETVLSQREDPGGALEFSLGKAEDMLTAFADLSELAKNGYRPDSFAKVNLFALLSSICERLRPDCEAAGIILTLRCGKTLNAYCKTKGLETAVQNLLFNTLEHAECKHIEIAAAKAGDRISLTVSDDGKGVPEGLPLFEPGASGGGANNSGLGLAIVKNEVLGMGGTVECRQLSPGTQFILTLMRA